MATIFEFDTEQKIDGSTLVPPDTWMLVGGGPLKVELKSFVGVGKLLVNNTEDELTSLRLNGSPSYIIYETEVQSVYVFGTEGTAVLVRY